MEKLIKVFAAVFSTNFTTIVQFIYEMDTLVHELLKEIGNGLDEQRGVLSLIIPCNFHTP